MKHLSDALKRLIRRKRQSIGWYPQNTSADSANTYHYDVYNDTTTDATTCEVYHYEMVSGTIATSVDLVVRLPTGEEIQAKTRRDDKKEEQIEKWKNKMRSMKPKYADKSSLLKSHWKTPFNSSWSAY